MSTKSPAPLTVDVFPDTRIGIVAARFNAEIVEKLVSGCLGRLEELKIERSRIEIFRVPGAFELPVAAKMLAESRRFRGIVCLGCVVRGDTPHFEYVAGECARGLQRVALDERLPVIFGVLTTENEQQAHDRAGGKHGHAGRSAADAVVEMIALSRAMHGGGGR